mmetsp:Transcript_29384/g.90932  ORF Transcript_29384/g.90932 Transcript_29384/m.90932 type:complete len:228 (-) Transcript_29384:256-939(-)
MVALPWSTNRVPPPTKSSGLLRSTVAEKRPWSVCCGRPAPSSPGARESYRFKSVATSTRSRPVPPSSPASQCARSSSARRSHAFFTSARPSSSRTDASASSVRCLGLGRCQSRRCDASRSLTASSGANASSTSRGAQRVRGSERTPLWHRRVAWTPAATRAWSSRTYADHGAAATVANVARVTTRLMSSGDGADAASRREPVFLGVSSLFVQVAAIDVPRDARGFAA